MSGIFMTDDAPLVQLNDICSGISIESNYSGDEVRTSFGNEIMAISRGSVTLVERWFLEINLSPRCVNVLQTEGLL